MGSKSLRPYLEFIHRRWDEGCHNASQIWREMCAMGYDCSANTVLNYCARLRQGLVTRVPERAAVQPQVRRYSPAEAARLFMSMPHKLTNEQAEHLKQMREADPALEQTYVLTQMFLGMISERDPRQLQLWMRNSLTSSLTPFKTFAAGLHRDRQAVMNALTLPWSNGQVERNINRLKLIKRQMYGRARFALLRVRVLYRN